MSKAQKPTGDDYCPKSKTGAHVIDPKSGFKDAQLAADTARDPDWAVSFQCRACERGGLAWLGTAELMAYIRETPEVEISWEAERDGKVVRRKTLSKKQAQALHAKTKRRGKKADAPVLAALDRLARSKSRPKRP